MHSSGMGGLVGWPSPFPSREGELCDWLAYICVSGGHAPHTGPTLRADTCWEMKRSSLSLGDRRTQNWAVRTHAEVRPESASRVCPPPQLPSTGAGEPKSVLLPCVCPSMPHINGVKIAVAGRPRNQSLSHGRSWPQLAFLHLFTMRSSLTAVNSGGKKGYFTHKYDLVSGDAFSLAARRLFNVNLFSFHLPTRTNTGVIASECGILFVIFSAFVFFPTRRVLILDRWLFSGTLI